MLTEETKQARRGMITASQAYRIVGARGLGQGGKTYMRELIAEEMGYEKPEINTYAIDWGNMYAPIAIEEYEKYTGLKVDFSGAEEKFIPHLNYPDHVGCTPDGYVEKINVGAEVKCPETGSTHISFLELETGVDLKALCKETTSATVKHVWWQIQFSLWVTGWDAWHFISFHPQIKGNQLKIVCVYPDKEDIKLIEERVIECLALKSEILKKIA